MCDETSLEPVLLENARDLRTGSAGVVAVDAVYAAGFRRERWSNLSSRLSPCQWTPYHLFAQRLEQNGSAWSSLERLPYCDVLTWVRRCLRQLAQDPSRLTFGSVVSTDVIGASRGYTSECQGSTTG